MNGAWHRIILRRPVEGDECERTVLEVRRRSAGEREPAQESPGLQLHAREQSM
jgi:hypothetical protein